MEAMGSLWENVILITIDTLRADHLPQYGYGRNTTPFLNDLCRTGFVHPKYYSNAPFTLASFSAIMTGLYPLTNNDIFYEIGDRKTLAEVLSESGILTLGVNSNFLLTNLRDYSRGFRIFKDLTVGTRGPERGSEAKSDEGLVRTAKKWIIGVLKRWPALDSLIYSFVKRPPPPAYPIAGEVVNAFSEIVREHSAKLKDNPFFAWIHFMEPHGPHYATNAWYPRKFSGWITRFRETRILNESRRIIQGRNADLRRLEKIRRYFSDVYDDKISYVDSSIRSLVRILRREGLSERTLLIVTSDHGEMLHDRPGLVGHPSVLYEPLVRVPLMLCPLDRSDHEWVKVRSGVASSVDLVPTILRLLSVQNGGLKFHGRDLLSGNKSDLIFSEAASNLKRKTLTRFNELDDLLITFAVITEGGLKLIVDTIPSEGRAHYELYDLVNDPMEMRDLSDRNEEIKDLLNLLKRHMDEIGFNPSKALLKFKVRRRHIRRNP